MNDPHSEIAASVLATFRSTFGDDSGAVVSMAPGRVNLIGEYTDLNEGYVFPMTVDRGIYVVMRRRDDTQVRIKSVRFDELIEYHVDAFQAPTPGQWTSYVLGVVEEVRRRVGLEHGFDAVIDSNLCLGAGLSSSAALELATAVSLQQVFEFDLNRVEMARLCQRVEHKYAQVFCGIMDQFASGIGRAGHALLLDCRSLNYENIGVELQGHRIVVISSEVKRSLASSAYNERRAECQSGAEHFRRIDSRIRSLRDVDVEMFEAHKHGLATIVGQRCHHVISENQRTLDAAAALSSGDVNRFGDLMTASHQSLRYDFEVSCPELDLLVTLATDTDGVLGSRMTGAGFGGCTVSLVHEDAIALLTERLSAYTSQTGLDPRVFVLEHNLEAGPVELT